MGRYKNKRGWVTNKIKIQIKNTPMTVLQNTSKTGNQGAINSNT